MVSGFFFSYAYKSRLDDPKSRPIMFRLLILSASFIIASVTAECGCDGEPAFNHKVAVNAPGFQPRVAHIMSNVYRNATQVLNIVGLAASDPANDYYRYDCQSQCFEAQVRQAKVDGFGVNVRMVARVTDQGLENAVCHCESESPKICGDVLNNGIASRLQGIKCKLEGNCEL